jgi:glycosyltransferase involved in cell wall biosynthesis
MRILWVTNIPLLPLLKHWDLPITGNGYWMSTLFEELQKRGNCELGIITATNKPTERIEIDKAVFYNVHISKIDSFLFGNTEILKKRVLKVVQQIISEFQPEVIHIHGSEYMWGLLKYYNLTNIPIVLSLQGLMGPNSEYAWGNFNFLKILSLTNLRDFIRGCSLIRKKINYKKKKVDELKIIKSIDAIIGRTDFDKSFSHYNNASLKYYHVDEIIRDKFIIEKWSIEKCNRYQVVASGISLLKGTHILIEAMNYLVQDFPNSSLIFAGVITKSTEFRYFDQLIKKFKLGDKIKFLGFLNEDSLIELLSQSHCFVNPSFIENSSNALCEALSIGIPCVGSYSGGTPFMLNNGVLGKLFKSGNPIDLAWKIREIFYDDNGAIELGKRAKEFSIKRHERTAIADKTVAVYNEQRK